MDNLETEREKLLAIKKQFEQAVSTNQIETMREHVDDDFSFVTFTDRAFDDFDSFCLQWKKTRDEIIGSGEFSTQLIPKPTIFIDDIAISYGYADNKMIDRKGKYYEYSSNWTVIFKKVGENWKVIRGHNSLDPFANPMLKAGVKQKVMQYMALAFVAGIAVGASAFWLF